MSYWIQNSNNKSNPSRKEFGCDYISDIQKLPTRYKTGDIQEDDTTASYPVAFGSSCFCLENSDP